LKYADYQPLSSPGWLQRKNGAAYQGALGTELDVAVDRIRQAVLASFPDAPGGVLATPADALDHIGADRLLPRIAGEAHAAYAERLRTAWDAWLLAGTYTGLLRALARAGFPTGATGMNIIQRTKRYAYLSGDGLTGTPVLLTHNGFDFDGTPRTVWNQFVVLFASDVSGLTVGSQLALALNNVVRLWKPAKARYMGAVVIVSGVVWGWPIGTQWGAAGNWGDGVSRFIPPT